MILRQLLFRHQSSKQLWEIRRPGLWHHSILLSALLLLVTGAGDAARAETLKAKITVLSTSPARVRIEGERSKPARQWSFRNIYAGLMNLGERIEKLTLADTGGADVAVRRLAPGEYEAASAATRFVCEMTLDAPLFEGDAAHASWLTNERGFLMTGDLLPLAANENGVAKMGASLKFVLPEGWRIAMNADAGGDGLFEVPDVESAVFFAGHDLREKRQRVGAMEFAFVTAGEWAFSDEEAAGLAASILKDHAQTFGGAAQGRLTLMLSPFPRAAGADHWSAETRGATVTMLAGKSPSKTAALAQLSFPLAHELFHLWIPNGLALDGDYDWFYEGFTLYQALRASVRLNLLTFQDYLNALARAFDAYRSAQGREKMSLLEASERRWTLSPALVYNKGMLAAFLYDLSLRQKTGGKRSLDDVYRELFRLHSAFMPRANGNQAALAALNNAGDMRELTARYIESTTVIDLSTAIAPFGLVVETSGARTRISVAERLSGAERDLLRKFGYNERPGTGHTRGRLEERK
jgi:predicted metalloprotease with PDZ domain